MLIDLSWSTFSVFLADKSRIFAIWAVSGQINSLPNRHMPSSGHWAYCPGGRKQMLMVKENISKPRWPYHTPPKWKCGSSPVQLWALKNPRILFGFVYAYTDVCKFTHKHTHPQVFVGVLGHISPNNLSRKQSTTLKLIECCAVCIFERKNRVKESIFPTDTASPNAFAFTQGTF